MSIVKLIQRIRDGEKTKTAEERKARLVRARILDAQGNFDPRFFPSCQVPPDSENKDSISCDCSL